MAESEKKSQPETLFHTHSGITSAGSVFSTFAMVVTKEAMGLASSVFEQKRHNKSKHRSLTNRNCAHMYYIQLTLYFQG
jgi:hypothetical protein